MTEIGLPRIDDVDRRTVRTTTPRRFYGVHYCVSDTGVIRDLFGREDDATRFVPSS